MKKKFSLLTFILLAMLDNTTFAQKTDTTYFNVTGEQANKKEATTYTVREKLSDRFLDKNYYKHNHQLIAENEVVTKEGEEYIITTINFGSNNKPIFKEFYSVITNDDKGSSFKTRIDSQQAFLADGSVAKTDYYKSGKKESSLFGTTIAESVDTMAEFPGGQNALMDFLENNITYPKEALKNQTTGTVYVEFKVCTDGSLCNYKIVRSVSPEIDEEVLRTMKKMPTWKPAIKDGKKVNTYFTLPVMFETAD